jgi:cyanophycin synthetase
MGEISAFESTLMKLLEARIMRGPNYWSGYRKKVIVLKIDLEELEDFPTNKIEGFYERLSEAMPSLYEHQCSEHRRGGFFERVRTGTWMGHVIEHLAIELQSLAGMYCGYGRTRSARARGIYHVVFEYEHEQAGLFAAEESVNLALALVNNESYDLNSTIGELKQIKLKYDLGPSTGALMREAQERRIPVTYLRPESLVVFGQGIHQRRMRATIASTTSVLAVDIACNKEDTKRLLARADVPLAPHRLVSDMEDLDEAIADIGFPLVVKPVDGNHGRGITTNISSREEAIAAFEAALLISPKIMIEKFIPGIDYRFLVINYKLVAVAKRTPALVIGDGYSSIEKLVEKTNNDPERGDGHAKALTKIKLDEKTLAVLAKKNLDPASILPLGEVLLLRETANLSTGGTSRDVTDLVHPNNKILAERIARLIGLDICGIDMMAQDITIPVREGTGAVLEVNACPGIRMHLSPSRGFGRNVAGPIVEMLFPPGAQSRIPLVAITGTNGKTTTTRLIAHLAKYAGYQVGFCTTDGVYIRDEMIRSGDCTGAKSAETILLDPGVDFAVLECARGGILRSGLGFDHCDVSVITNISEDHVGLEDVESITEMAKVKAVVAESTFDDGYAILNADDDLVYDLQYELHCRVALFSMVENNNRVLDHCANGGIACVIEKGYVTVYKGQWKTRIEKVERIPICFGGRATLMIKNVLPAVLAAMVRNFSIENIREGLLSFIPSHEKTPGRMNLFRFRDFELMVDYAHNAGSFADLKHFMENTPASQKIGIITAVGDRRDEEIRNVGFHAAQLFDKLIIRHDKDLRGRVAGELTQLLMSGIRNASPGIEVAVIPDELEAIRYAMEQAPKNAFIVVFTEDVWKSTSFAAAELAKEKELKNRIDQIHAA